MHVAARDITIRCAHMEKGFKHINEKAASVEGDFFSAFIYIWSVP
jgi:hypothetical protein